MTHYGITDSTIIVFPNVSSDVKSILRPRHSRTAGTLNPANSTTPTITQSGSQNRAEVDNVSVALAVLAALTVLHSLVGRHISRLPGPPLSGGYLDSVVLEIDDCNLLHGLLDIHIYYGR